MLARLHAWWRGQREARALARHAIPDALWQATLQRYPFIAQRSSSARAELQRLASLFLAEKEFHGAQGLKITDDIAVAIAAQACLPILQLGLGAYSHFVGVVVQPHAVRARRQEMDEDGIAHEFVEELSGEAMEGGPVMVAWEDAAHAPPLSEYEAAYNVVVHEFVHAIDMRSGEANGVPPMPAHARLAWAAALKGAMAEHAQRRAQGLASVIDDYAATHEAEFFAVSAEAFFTAADRLHDELPAWYAQLSRYFGQDPVLEATGA